MTFLLTPGQAHDQQALAPLLDSGAVKRPGRGRPRLRPRAVVGDKGYASGKARRACRRRGIRPVIPAKADERRQPRFPHELYRERNQVERLVSRLKQWRRIATRYDKRASSYAAFVSLVMLRMWV